MRGPRIRRIGYVTRAASDLAELLAPLTSPAPHDNEVGRWCQRLARTRDWQRLRFSERGVHLANNVVIGWLDPRDVMSRPAFLDVLRAVRDCARESRAALCETLTERGLWPWQPGDPTAPRWWCDDCGGTGRDDYDEAQGLWSPCHCDDGVTDDPPSLSALVAVAALGAMRLRMVADVVGEMRRVTRVDGAATLGDRVAWRVMTREALCEHHEERARNACVGRAAWLCATFSACVNAAQWIDGVDPYGTDHRPLRALHDCGVHLLDADARRVVIGVKAL